MTSRAVAFVAGTALLVLVLGAVRLAAADPLASPGQAPPAAPSRERAGAPASVPATASPRAPASVPAAQWTVRKQTSVSAGVLVRAASRKPLDRGPACPPAGGAQASEEPAASGCTQSRARGEPIEIDWHGERAAP